jgi:hypothetical protein
MVMPKSNPAQKQSKIKKWAINLIIFIIALALMLGLGEGVMRWIDGYRLSTLELNQDTTLPPTE